MSLVIFRDIILPIFLLIGLGVLLDRRFSLDLPTLSRLNFWVFVPALVFLTLLRTTLEAERILLISIFGLVHVLLLYALGSVFFRHRWFRGHLTPLLLGSLFFNAGNYGLPMAFLAFGDVGTGVMAIYMVMQNLATFSLGLWILQQDRFGARAAVGHLLQVPVVWAVVLGLLLPAVGWMPPLFIMQPLTYLGQALIGLALLTLGVQLSRTPLLGSLPPLSAAIVFRLILSPMVAMALVWTGGALLGIEFGELGPILIAATALPTAVNVYVLCQEYDHSPGLVSQMVVWTTLFSALTMTFLLTWLK